MIKSQDYFDLKDKVALITGATGGLGSCISKTLANYGAKIIISDYDEVRCKELVEELNDMGMECQYIVCDLSTENAGEDLAKQAFQIHQKIDICVGNAGIADNANTPNEKIMRTNLRANVDMTDYLAPKMAQQGGGSIIFMSSIAGVRGNKALNLYSLSKAALVQLARNTAVQWGSKNVRANAISPGLIRTPLSTGLLQDETFMSKRMQMTPLRRVGEPEEIASIVLLLASAAGGFITGQNIVADGGTVITDGS